MAAFDYTAIDQAGRHHRGVMEADHSKAVRRKLRAKGLTPLNVITTQQTNSQQQEGLWQRIRQRRLSHSELALMTRQMATLLSAGLPIDEVLTSVSRQTRKHHVRRILLSVRANIQEGRSLADAISLFPTSFSKLYCTTVAAGERSGDLAAILEYLADYIDRQREVKQSIQQALIYPLMMVVVSFLVVTFLLSYVVPKIVTVLAQTEQQLPLVTSILITMSHIVTHDAVFILLAMFVSVYIGYRLWCLSVYRAKFDAILMKLPIIGRSWQRINVARYGRTLGMLTQAHVPLLESMHASAKLMTITPMRQACMAAVNQVREGKTVASALEQTDYFSPLFIHLVGSGESSGQLAEMLAKAAQQQQADIDMLISGFIKLFEPIMILLMGAVVLFIVLAVMLPIFDLDQFPGM